jgi:hypothetical protein
LTEAEKGQGELRKALAAKEVELAAARGEVVKELRPNFRLIGCRCRVVLDCIDLDTDYQIVLHLLFPEVEVRPVELPNAHL